MVDPTHVRRVFDRAVSLPAAERAAFVESACADDPALRRELERLLGAHDRAASVFETASRHAPPAASTTTRPLPLTLPAGARLGPYEITAPLGAGGMGEVYKARDTRLDRSVAIKVLAPGVTSDPAARQRLEREARAAAALAHPHICMLLDIGRQDDLDYLVMEYLDGETLAARLARGRLPLDDAASSGWPSHLKMVPIPSVPFA